MPSKRKPGDLSEVELDAWGLRVAAAHLDQQQRRAVSFKEVASSVGLAARFGKGTAKDDVHRERLARRWFERAVKRDLFRLALTPTFRSTLNLEAASNLSAAVNLAVRGREPQPDIEILAVEVPDYPYATRPEDSDDDAHDEEAFDTMLIGSDIMSRSLAYQCRIAVAKAINDARDPSDGNVAIAVGSGRSVGHLVRSFASFDSDDMVKISEGVRFGQDICVRSLGGLLAVNSGMSPEGGTFDADFNARALAAAFAPDDMTPDKRRLFESRVQLVEYPLIARDPDDREIENLHELFHPVGGLGDVVLLGIGVLDDRHHFNEGHFRLNSVREIVDEIRELSLEVGTPLVAHMCNRYWIIDPRFLPVPCPTKSMNKVDKLCRRLNSHIRAAALRDISLIERRFVTVSDSRGASPKSQAAKDAALATLLATDMTDDGREEAIIAPPTTLVTNAAMANRVSALLNKRC